MKMFFVNYKKTINNYFFNTISCKSFSEETSKSSTLSKIFFNYGVCSLPHTEKRHKGGEDAYMAQDGLIAVADGVGGWNEIGVDPSLYSKDLCNNIQTEYLADKAKKSIDIFVNACKKITNRGSSTCCMCKIHSETEIEALNLGDSGYLLLRPSFSSTGVVEDFSVVFKSEEQTHGFNFPFQVGEGGDNPKSAIVKYHEVQPFDLVVLASDGLWDNISNGNLVKVIKNFVFETNKAIKTEENKDENTNQVVAKTSLSNLKGLSEYITKTAEIVSLDKQYKSPFAIRSRGLYMGGKHDDITVIVAQVLEKTAKF